MVVSAIWVGSGLLFGALGGWDGRGAEGDDGRGPPGIVFAIIAAAVLATVVAYRRLARPVSELLEGAERIGGGDYDARVRPGGPRAVRTLGTAFNEMASRLDSSEQSRRRFLADVTHELRTPLTVLHAEVEAQLDGIHPRDDAHLHLLAEQVRTLERLVEDLRTLALGDAGRLMLHREVVSIDVVVEDAVAAIAAAAVARDVDVRIAGRCGAEHGDVYADPVRIAQVLANLLTNAVRHTPPGDTVTVAASVDADADADDHVLVKVSDTGPGLGEHPDRVFDRFHASADSGGSGLGLTISRQLVEAHGGTLDAGNDPAGGATFTVRLPTPRPPEYRDL